MSQAAKNARIEGMHAQGLANQRSNTAAGPHSLYFDPVTSREDQEWLYRYQDARGNDAPHSFLFGKAGRWEDLRSRQQPMIRRMHQGAFAGALDTFRAREGYSNRRAGDQLRFQGLAPSTFSSLVQPELDYSRAGQVAGMRQQAVAGQAGDQKQLDLSITNVEAEEERYYDQIALSQYLAKKTEDASQRGGFAQLGAGLIRGAATIGASYIGGPAAGAAAGAATSQVNP